MSNFNTINGYVIIEKKKESTTQSGIVLTNQTDDYNQGIVKSIDAGNFLGVNEGDEVLFDQAKASVALIGGNKYFIVPEDQIFSILKG